MTLNFKHLNDLLKCNKNIKIGFIENTNTLEIKNLSKILLTLDLKSNDIENNAKIIYEAITSLENITLYIPKIYIPEKMD
ncbi:hypothetical protein C672_2263 [[Clostridium] bifermentans ATCC 638]|uniref:Uncharacterized protein n=1 Tax=Paraclostridium bifermentans ATCC 638 = DSM 14991 TaxID=1233171 RepID=T4VHX3_PARBF|nr:hypothetical protein [Paraclostridium bifermentans]EQK43319.1 hypothetical protein C672_2263 [[Clostridium] bifermentans ATCC 638] [Paraclostridium bifermentans ATCC 638 = DSM 14991]RIZ60535.1 hypothetical protein CHH45_01820 [Paraclostridium bifermentans]UAG17178.1 hypothetical protein KXZ80_10330 [Paraclostridium bifermentans]